MTKHKPKANKNQKPKKRATRAMKQKVSASQKARWTELKKFETNGLVQPSDIKLDSPEFIKLQNKWYDKLEDSGFDDLEWLDPKSGNGQGSSHLKYNKPWGSKINNAESVEQYFAMFRNFITHMSPHLTKEERTMLNVHVEGASYQDMHAALVSKHNIKYSLTSLFSKFCVLKERVLNWNTTSPNGLLVTRAENNAIMDKFFEERFAGRGESSNLTSKEEDLDLDKEG